MRGYILGLQDDGTERSSEEYLNEITQIIDQYKSVYALSFELQGDWKETNPNIKEVINAP